MLSLALCSTTLVQNTFKSNVSPTVRIIEEFRSKQEAYWTKTKRTSNVQKEPVWTTKKTFTASVSAVSAVPRESSAISEKIATGSNRIVLPHEPDRPAVAPAILNLPAIKDVDITPAKTTIVDAKYDIIYPNSKNISCYHDFKGIHVNEHNVFLYNSLCKVPSDSEIVNFRGKRKYTDMGLDFSNPHIVLHGKNPVKRWSDLAGMMKEKQSEKPENRAVHVHNEIKIGDFLHFILKEHIARNNAMKGVPK